MGNIVELKPRIIVSEKATNNYISMLKEAFIQMLSDEKMLRDAFQLFINKIQDQLGNEEAIMILETFENNSQLGKIYTDQIVTGMLGGYKECELNG